MNREMDAKSVGCGEARVSPKNQVNNAIPLPSVPWLHMGNLAGRVLGLRAFWLPWTVALVPPDAAAWHAQGVPCPTGGSNESAPQCLRRRRCRWLLTLTVCRPWSTSAEPCAAGGGGSKGCLLTRECPAPRAGTQHRSYPEPRGPSAKGFAAPQTSTKYRVNGHATQATAQHRR